MVTKKKNGSEIALYLSLFSVTVFFHLSFYDPFNLPKMLILGFFVLFGIHKIIQSIVEKKYNKPSLVLSILLILLLSLLLLNFFLSDISLWQFLMGSYQRNLGFLTYGFFIIVAIWVSLIQNRKLPHFFLYLLVTVGALEIFYGLIQNSGKDFVAWKNPYSPIIGSFGNPNFMSAFLGLASSASVLLVLALKNLTLGMKSLLLILGVLGQYLCFASSSIQGNFVFVTALSVYFAIVLFRKYQRYISITYLSVLFIGVVGVVFSLNNKGPLGNLLYQTSISARGDYWRAAIKASNERPLTGLGMDNFGEAYLKYRDLTQVQNRGFGTFTNNAHNTFLQFASTTGVLSALLLISIICFVIIFSLLRLLNKAMEFDAVQAGVLSLFISCLPVMMISIDNIGFNIWFWSLIGLLISSRHTNSESAVGRADSHSGFKRFIPELFVIPLAATLLWFSIQVSTADIFLRDIFQSESTITSPIDLIERVDKRPSFFDNEEKYLVTISAISLGRNWFEESKKFAELAIKLNPQGLDGWRLTALSNEGMNQTEAAIEARERILKLDQFRLDNMLELTRGYLKLGLYSKALEIVNRMEEISPKDTFTLAAIETLRAYKE